jgi:hypothetical protein
MDPSQQQRQREGRDQIKAQTTEHTPCVLRRASPVKRQAAAGLRDTAERGTLPKTERMFIWGNAP